jgi:S-DNA-T family DNA segregation ATPase FtsK/SpoIIIE
MARKKRKSPLRPRVPARVKKRRGKKSQRGHHHPELWGLVLTAAGIVLATLFWFRWEGGVVGGPVEDGLRGAIGAAASVAPAALVVLGLLMVSRSELVDVRPFRTGFIVFSLGLLLALGADHGGLVGRGLEGIVGTLLGSTGATIVGVTTLVVGALLLSGASAGALLRGSGRAVRSAARNRPRTTTVPRPVRQPVLEPHEPPVDVLHDYPDVVGEAPLLIHDLHDEQTEIGVPAIFEDTLESHSDYELPDRTLLRHSSPAKLPAKTDTRIADALVLTLANFGVDATIVGQIAGPRVTRYELQLAPGTKVAKVAALKDDLSYALATTEIRILAPIPGKQAVGVEVPNLSPNIVTLGDIFDDLPATASPLSVWLGKDISGSSVWTDLARMPHILIAGTTGSGKSGCINTILTSILLRATPDDVRMILIDPASTSPSRTC